MEAFPLCADFCFLYTDPLYLVAQLAQWHTAFYSAGRMVMRTTSGRLKSRRGRG